MVDWPRLHFLSQLHYYASDVLMTRQMLSPVNLAFVGALFRDWGVGSGQLHVEWEQRWDSQTADGQLDRVGYGGEEVFDMPNQK